MKRELRIIFLFILLIITSIYAKRFFQTGHKTSVDLRDYPGELLPCGHGEKVVHKHYLLSYKEDYEQAEWVLYRLTADEIRHAHHFKRPYFKKDPGVTTGSADYHNFKSSGYDKGHLCPAYDLSYDREAYEETFYTSNISPQNHDFNSGIWNRLEQKVRYWAQKYGEIYVITGGVLKPGLITIGKEQVSVPEYFYKIVYDPARRKAVAFMIPNRKSKLPLYSYTVSIDKIEAETKIDFFCKMPDSLQKPLESVSRHTYRNF